MRKRYELPEDERKLALAMFRGGRHTVKEICDRFGIYPADLKRMAHEEGYGY